MGNNLTSAQSLAYQGTNAASPSNVTVHYNAPTANFYQGFSMGDFWVHRISPTSNQNELWVLMGVAGNVANWVLLTGNMGPLLSLTGNSGGAVFPLAGNINVVGDGTTIQVVGNPGTHTLTISAMGTGTVSSLTTDDGHIVTPTAGTIIVHGTNGITTTGTVGPNTVTVTASGTVAQSFPTDSGTAVPSSGVLNIKAGVSTLNCGSSVEFTGSGNTVLLNVTDTNNNTIIGKSSGHASVTGTNNTVIGSSSATSLTSGTYNVIIGEASGTALTSEINNVLLNAPGVATVSGLVSLNSKFRTVNSPFMHNWPGDSSSNGSNFFAGNGCGNFSLGNSDVQNTGFGQSALNAIAPGATSNTVVGFEGLMLMTSGSLNTAIGCATGYSAGGSSGLLTGSENIIIGNLAGSSYTSSESNNICIGTTGVVSESAVIRLGAFNGGETLQTKCFIQGIRGTTTVNANAVAVLIDSAGQLGTVSSSIRYKENVQDMADESSPLMKLRPVIFNYKKQGLKDYGLIAEEVAEIFPELVIFNDQGEPETVKYHILCSILLNEVQKLSKRIEKLESTE